MLIKYNVTWIKFDVYTVRIILLVVSLSCVIACSQSPYMCTAVIGGVQYASKNAMSKRAAKQAAGTLL